MAVNKTAYDDGGISGGTMERPALQRLLADIRDHKIDTIVVYKVDRLTRSLADFAKMVELFDGHSVSFVSVTQQFNTTTSMGRLTLNVLLSFAQFEREVTGERIRDKIAASKAKGMWMGGFVPLGYDLKERKLLINPAEAETVRNIYQRYLELGCVRMLKMELDKRDIRSKNGSLFSRGALYVLLSNPIYVGQIRHKAVLHAGQHEPIIEQALWEQARQRLADNRNGIKTLSRKTEPCPLAGKLFDTSGERLVPVYANKKGRRYRYYISDSLTKNLKSESTSVWRLPGQEIEQTVMHLAAQMIPNGDAVKIENIQCIELGPEGIRLTLPVAGVPITRDFPMRIKRRGVEMRLVVGGVFPAKVDKTLLNTVIRAHKWFSALATGTAKSISEIAEQERVSRSYVSRIINLAFLAPEITEAIVTGHQPVGCTVDRLTKGIELPVEWPEQRRVIERL